MFSFRLHWILVTLTLNKAEFSTFADNRWCEVGEEELFQRGTNLTSVFVCLFFFFVFSEEYLVHGSESQRWNHPFFGVGKMLLKIWQWLKALKKVKVSSEDFGLFSLNVVTSFTERENPTTYRATGIHCNEISACVPHASISVDRKCLHTWDINRSSGILWIWFIFGGESFF